MQKGIFRANDWWKSKAALLMGMVYLYTLWFGLSFYSFLLMATLSLVTITGFASTGYLLNDLFDIRSDLKAGKFNSLAGKPIILVAVYFVIAIAMLFLPWLRLPFNTISLLLLAAEIILFLIYSVPPLRLKERGVAGVVTDSLYAHVVPVLLATYTFSLATGYHLQVWQLLPMLGWQFAMGIRNILIHQFDDIAADKAAGSKTWVQRITHMQFYMLILNITVVEVLLSLAFFLVLTIEQPHFIALVFLIAFLCAMALIRFKEAGIKQMLESRSKVFPNMVYEKWMPVVVLFILGLSNHYYWIVMLLHMAVFAIDTYYKLTTQSSIYGSKLYWQIERIPFKYPFSMAINYLIYFMFRLFGVDLKREKLSAKDYLTRKKEGNR